MTKDERIDYPLKCRVCRRWMRRRPLEGNKLARPNCSAYVQRRAVPHADRCTECKIIRACGPGRCEQCRDLGLMHAHDNIQMPMSRRMAAFSRLWAKFLASDARPYVVAADDPDGLVLEVAGHSVVYMADGSLLTAEATTDAGAPAESAASEAAEWEGVT